MQPKLVFLRAGLSDGATRCECLTELDGTIAITFENATKQRLLVRKGSGNADWKFGVGKVDLTVSARQFKQLLSDKSFAIEIGSVGVLEYVRFADESRTISFDSILLQIHVDLPKYFYDLVLKPLGELPHHEALELFERRHGISVDPAKYSARERLEASIEGYL